MSDPQLHSIHLGESPRRDLFRQARNQLEGACGTQTLTGYPPPTPSDQVLGDGITVSVQPIGENAGPTYFFLKDGNDIHPLTVGVNSVGRLPDNNVVIKDEHVSRRHCAVVVHSNGSCEVHDIASKNGTLLNGKRISGPTRLKPGDYLLLCSRKLQFLVEAPAAVPAG
jgi:pSer/pThr/pTyr-binding forkhead associated (FHA) protein